MSSNQQQTNFEASCGTEILRETSRIRIPWRKRVWLAIGEVMDKFDNEVMPEIEALLQTEDPGYAEYCFSVVMVGLRQATAKPKILVSCTNSDVRTEVLRIIKSSHHIRDMYPEFGFGESSVPLHEPIPSVPLAGKVKSRLRTTPQDDIPAFVDVPSTKSPLQRSRVGEVVASDHNPSIGRKLFVSSTETEPARYATGGIVVLIGDKYYQKTVGHIDESECDPIPQWSPDDIDYCRFDDDSDDEDDDTFRFDSDITSRGSMTPEDNLSQVDSLDGSDTASFSLTADLSSPGDQWRYPQFERADAIDVAHQPSPSDDGMGGLPGLTNVGRLEHNSRAGKKPGLDYAFVRLNGTFDPEKANRICVDATMNTHVRIRGVEPIAAVERDIVTVTASGGIARGKIMPSAVYFRSPNQRSFQKLYVVYISTVVVDGDCGADVVDAKTGNLYGHIVRGCRGTQIAYIVSAKDVFEDLKDRLGITPEVVFPGQTGEFVKHGAENHSIGGSPHVPSQEQSNTRPDDECYAELDGVMWKKISIPGLYDIAFDNEWFGNEWTPARQATSSYCDSEMSFVGYSNWPQYVPEPTSLNRARQTIRLESWWNCDPYSSLLPSYPGAELNITSDFPGDDRTSAPYLQPPPPLPIYEIFSPASHNSRPHAARRRLPALKGKPERWSRTATPSPTAFSNALDFASRIVFPGQTEDLAKHGADHHSIGGLSHVPSQEQIGFHCHVENGATPGQAFLRESSGETIQFQFPENIGQAPEQTFLSFRLFADLANGIAILNQDHDQSRHGDLKPHNILLTKRSDSAPSKVSFKMSDFGIGLIDRRHFPSPSFYSGPRRFIIYDEPHVSGVLGSDGLRPRSTTDTCRPKDLSMVSGNEFHPASRSGPDIFAELTSVAEMPNTDDRGLPCEFVGYNSCNEPFPLKDTEERIEHIISQYLRDETLKKSACWYCDDPISEVQRSDLHAMVNFRDRLDHIRGHIRNDDSSKGQTRPDPNLAPLTWKMIADSLCFSEGGATTLVRVNQIETTRQHRLWARQEIALASTFSRASKSLRRKGTHSSLEFHSHLQVCSFRYSPSMLDTVGIRIATRQTLQYARFDPADYPTHSKYDMWAIGSVITELLTWSVTMNDVHSMSQGLLWRTSDSCNARGKQTDRKGDLLSFSTGAPDEIALPSWVPDNKFNWAALNPIWTTTDMSDIIVSHLPGMGDVNSYLGASDLAQGILRAHIAKSVGRRRIPRGKHMCLVPRCESKTFQRTSDLQRHDKIHGPENHVKQFNCDHTRCRRNAELFHRMDHFRDHYRDFQKDSPELRRLMGDGNALMIMIWCNCLNLLNYPHGLHCCDVNWQCCNCSGNRIDHGDKGCPGCHECPHCLVT